jgi:hypothetical protein
MRTAFVTSSTWWNGTPAAAAAASSALPWRQHHVDADGMRGACEAGVVVARDEDPDAVVGVVGWSKQYGPRAEVVEYSIAFGEQHAYMHIYPYKYTLKKFILTSTSEIFNRKILRSYHSHVVI